MKNFFKNLLSKCKNFLIKLLSYSIVKIILAVIVSALLTWVFDTALMVLCFLIITYLMYELFEKIFNRLNGSSESPES